MDELWSYLKRKKCQLWVFISLEVSSRFWLGFELGARTLHTANRLVAQFKRFGKGAFPKCDIFLAHKEHHNLPLDNTVPLARWEEITMLATMLQDFVCELEAQVEQWAQELGRTLDLAKLEEELSERMQRLYAGVVGQVLTELLSEPSYLEALRRLGGRRGMRFKEYRRGTGGGGQGPGVGGGGPHFFKDNGEGGGQKGGADGGGGGVGFEVVGG